jgi:CheY-like chemotaxis protein
MLRPEPAEGAKEVTMNRVMVDAIVKTGQGEVTPSAGFSERKGIAKGLSVLIVEDHDASRHCLEGLLQKDGYSVCSFPCAEDGLVQLAADHFDVLLTDLHLPGMHGLELIGKAKAVQPSIHVLMMTAAVTEEVRQRALLEKVDSLMEKPIEVDQLLAFLDSIRLHIETGS